MGMATSRWFAWPRRVILPMLRMGSTAFMEITATEDPYASDEFSHPGSLRDAFNAVISAFQIVGSLLRVPTIEWPENMASVFDVFEKFSFDQLFQFQSLACL